jgi:cholesterol oxidase
MDAMMERIADAAGGRYVPLPTCSVLRRPITVHPLGGCRVSERPGNGVVSTRGEVRGYPGLFVAGGSVIPTAVGCHPAMTIAVVREYIADGAARG